MQHHFNQSILFYFVFFFRFSFLFLLAEAGDQTANDVLRDGSTALGISQLLTRLNPADQSCHILAAHAMFHSGCVNDAETKLKKMLQGKQQVLLCGVAQCNYCATTCDYFAIALSRKKHQNN